MVKKGVRKAEEKESVGRLERHERKGRGGGQKGKGKQQKREARHGIMCPFISALQW